MLAPTLLDEHIFFKSVINPSLISIAAFTPNLANLAPSDTLEDG